ncbi:hypothetical protein L6452_39287 [Arctium lappa]|uniref:Uncharacterized protein n=1 Tax=Arctium lappa TaxID=4217 RepID=A0ACB8XSL9_ARCLA|nr:hypothetical protein L6452_39287 [Arctium lappa]
MAAKSDFAQKLLNDLRIRKERMGASTRANAATARGTSSLVKLCEFYIRFSLHFLDAYRNPGNMQRGSRHTKSLESIGGPKITHQRPMSSAVKEASQQLVSYAGGRHQRSESIGDLSMAFTYAVKNGGKLMNMDFSASAANTNKMIDFLHQIGRRSLDAGDGRNGRSIVQHHRHSLPPVLTAVQIKEISKGVQNLYEVLRSSSNGMNVSMEVGKELLKGAKGLEESLRMLVNLQEASEMMVTPQRKSRITLLEVDDDDDGTDGSKIVDRNQVALPRFSFDKPSKRSGLPLTNANSSALTMHRRSDSSGAESIRTGSNAENTSNRAEKGRISNVIAKLMGLEEVPRKLDESKNVQPRVGIAEKQVNKIPKPVKDAIASLTNRKSQQLQDSNISEVPRPLRTSAGTKQSTTNRLDRVPEKPERRSNSETKEKIQQKRRSPEIAANSRVEKKKTTRIEKSSEIRLVPRNNRNQEPEKRTQKSKQDSHQIKHSHNQDKSKDSPSKDPQIQPFEENLKAKEATPMVQESEPERPEAKVQPPVAKEKLVARKKADSMAVNRSEALRRKDDVLKRGNGSRNSLERQSKHKLSVLKETKRKNVQQLGPIRSKPEDTSSKRSNSEKPESITRYYENITNTISRVPIRENDIKTEPQEISEIVVVARKYASSDRINETSNLPENKPKKTFSQVVLTDQEKQLKEILIKDQLFLSTAEALFKLNIPVGFLHADDHNHHGDETKVKLDCGHEILRRKARSQELSAHPYMKPSVGCTIIRFLDELVKQLYKDLEGLRLYGRNAQNEADEADYLHHMLEKDIYNTNPDMNSFWDFGWHTMTFAFVEKDEFVKDLEHDLLCGLVDEIADELLSMRLCF